MSSFTQLLASHSHLLVLDAASTRVQVGFIRNDALASWRSVEQEAGTGLFTATQSLLGEAGTRLDEIDAFAFCEGPGSMLGTRTIAMALRTWQVLKPRPVYAYQSLALAAHGVWTQQARAFTVIADARRDTWHVQAVATDGRLATLQRVPVDELPAGELLTPENFRAWAQPPRPAATCSYDLAKIFATLGDGDYFRTTDAPDAFQHEAPEYRKWSAQVHSASTAPAK